jgi:hypothetical protein
VNCIWEGTTNVLALDVVRVLAKHPQALTVWARRTTQKAGGGALGDEVEHGVAALLRYAGRMPEEGAERAEASARAFATSVGRVHTLALLVEHARSTGSEVDFFAAQQWAQREQLVQLPARSPASERMVRALALGPAKL